MAIIKIYYSQIDYYYSNLTNRIHTVFEIAKQTESKIDWTPFSKIRIVKTQVAKNQPEKRLNCLRSFLSFWNFAFSKMILSGTIPDYDYPLGTKIQNKIVFTTSLKL